MLEILFAFDPVVLFGFIVAGFLLNLTPGADFVFVTANAITGGPRIGRAAALGINLGVLVHVAAAAAGVSALLIAHPAAYDIIRYAGAVYLLFIAWKAWTSTGGLESAEGALSAPQAIRRGFLTNVLNPKTALFIFAFIPQFTDPALGPIWMQIVLLGLIFTVNGFAFVLLLATTTGHLAPLLRNHMTTLNKITAILFGGLAARLVLD